MDDFTDSLFQTVPVYLQMSNSLTSWLPFLSLLREIVVQCSSFIQSLQQGKPDAVLIQSLLSSFTDCTASVRQALLIEGALECPALPQLSALIQVAILLYGELERDPSAVSAIPPAYGAIP